MPSLRALPRQAACLLVALLAAPGLVRAAATLDEAWRWTSFTSESGLPSDRASLVVPTTEGALVLSQRGVACFDGWEWKPVALPGFERGTAARGLSLAPDGHLIVVAGGALYHGDPKSMRPVPLGGAHAGWTVDLAFPFRGAMLALIHPEPTSLDAALVLLDDDGNEIDGEASADLPAGAYFLTCSGETVFAILPGGIVASDGGPWQTVIDAPGERLASRLLSGSRAGGHLFGVIAPREYRGLWSWSPGQLAQRIADEPQEGMVSLAVAPDGDALVSYTSGLLRWRRGGAWRSLEGSWPMLRESPDFAFGPDGSLWAATQDGVHRARAGSTRWTLLAQSSSGRRNSVNSILRDDAGCLWLATTDGIARYKADGTSEFIEQAAGASVAEATCVAQDGSGAIWITSGGGFPGAVRYERGRWVHVDVPQPSPGESRRIHRTIIDPSGQPLFLMLQSGDSTSAGVLHLDGGVLVPWEPAAGLPSQRVYDMVFGPRGEAWFATYRGIARFARGEWRTWSMRDGIIAPRIFDLALDPSGTLWFTDQLNGLGRISPEGRVSYTGTSDGLPSDETWAVEIDPEGRAWVTTAGGVACIDGETTWALGTESGLPLARTWPILAEREEILFGTLGAGAAILSLREIDEPAPRIDIEVAARAADAVTMSWRALAWQGAKLPSNIETRHRLDGGAWSRWSRDRSLVIPLRTSARLLEVEAKPAFPGAQAGRASRSVDFTVPFHRLAWFSALEAGAAIVALVVAVVLFVRRRRAAAELRNSEARFRLLSSVVTEGVAVVEARSRILDANPALGELLGREPAGLVGADLAAILGVSIPEAGAAPVELKIRRPDGDERVAEILARVQRWRGHVATVVVLRDVTDRKGAEAQRLEMELRLRRAHELESLGLLAGRIAHDFNNVLAAVIGNQDLAAESVTDPAGRAHLDQAQAAAKQAADLSRQMLAASGRGRLAVHDVDLTTQVDQMIDFLKASIPKSIRIERELAADLNAIEADPTQLGQVILNLVTNASDAIGPAGGTITLRTGRSDDGRGVFLEVEDDGAGMDAVTRARLFEPFFTTRPDGRGLGLVTVGAVAKAHGATIDVSSEPGQGARFRVTFPATQRRAPGPVAEAPPAPAPPPRARERAPLGLVLVADDEAMVRRLTAGFLTRLGATIVEAADGLEALRLVDAHGSGLHAAVLDLTMPGASGLEVLAGIRSEHPTLPVVLVTGYSREDVASRVGVDPHAGVLAKPFTAGELEQLLASLAVEPVGVERSSTRPRSADGPS